MLLHAKYNIFFHSLFLERWCSRTCIKRSPLGQRKSGLLRQVNSQKRFNSYETRKNCFRYLKLMSPLNAAICTTISYTLWVEWYYLKNNYLTLWSKVITVCNTPPYGHAPTYQISLTYLERQKCYGPDKKILFKKQLFDQGLMKVITVCDTPPYGHAPTYQI